YQLRGEIDRAISCYRKALEIRPDSASTHSNLLLTLHYRETDPQKIFDAHIDWARRHADPLSANIAPHTNSREPERRLRIGYVSADFKRHSVSFLFAPVLRGHNRERFEICCFDNAQVSDDVSKQI